MFPAVTYNTLVIAPDLPGGGSSYVSGAGGPANGTLTAVEDLSLPDTKALIAPRLKRAGYWADYKIETVVCGPDYEQLSFQKADHHVMS